MIRKACSACGESFPLDAFYVDARRAGRPRHRCKKCHVSQSKKNKVLRSAGFMARTGEIFYGAQNRAGRRNLEFSLTLEWVRARAAPGFCEATGLPFRYVNGSPYRMNPYGPSLDRIDPAMGYTPENTRVVVTAFNIMRNEYDATLVYEVFEAWRRHNRPGRSHRVRRAYLDDQTER